MTITLLTKIKDWWLGNYRCDECGEIGIQYWDEIDGIIYDDGFVCCNENCQPNKK